MPRINTNATTKQDLLNDRADNYITWALDQGNKRRETILREIHRRYPNASRRSIESVYDHVIGSRQAARGYRNIGEDERVAAARFRSNTGLPYRYRWIVRVSWALRGDERTGGFITIVESDTNLQKGEIRDIAIRQTYNEIQASRRQGDPYDRNTPIGGTIGIDILSAEKRAR